MRGLVARSGKEPGTDRYGERGIALPFVALSLVVLLGMASITIDIGNGYRTRRALIAATDSSALAAAQDFAVDDDGCLVAKQYLLANDADGTCNGYPTTREGQGYVVVEATANVQTWFAGIIGQGDYDAGALTAAVWGPPLAVTGLRPIGLCFEGSAALQDIVNNPPPTNTVLRIDYDKDHPDDCFGSETPGNWGVTDFNVGGNHFKEWVKNGYPGEVEFANHTVTSCAGEEAHCYGSDPGNPTGAQNELNGLRNSGVFFTVPVFNFVDESSGPGNNFEMHFMGVLRVQLLSFKVNGNPGGRYFEFLVEPGLITGTCCGPGGGAGDNKVIAICAVDPNAYLACEP